MKPYAPKTNDGRAVSPSVRGLGNFVVLFRYYLKLKKVDVITCDRQKDVNKLTAKFSSSCLLVSKLDMSPQQIEQQP